MRIQAFPGAVAVLVSLLSSSAAYAQCDGRIGGNCDQRRDAERQADQNRQRSSNRIDYYTPRGAAAPARQPAAPSAAALRWHADREAYAAEQNARLAQYRAGQARDEQLEYPYLTAAVRAGYEFGEARRFAANLRAADAAQPGEGARRTALLQGIMRDYLATRDTASFDQLRAQATVMVEGSAPITAFRIVQGIDARFPARAAELDPLRLAIFQSYFSFLSEPVRLWQPDGPTIHRIMQESWTAFEDMHPGAYRQLAGPMVSINERPRFRGPYAVQRDCLTEQVRARWGTPDTTRAGGQGKVRRMYDALNAREIAMMRRDGFPTAEIDAMVRQAQDKDRFRPW